MMAKTASFIDLGAIMLDAAVPQPLYRQIYSNLRAAILDGQIAPGTRLPPTRTLARELRVARTTIVNAFDQLIAEGYLEGKVGAGTYVTSHLPEEVLRVSSRLGPLRSPTGASADVTPLAPHRLSQRGAITAATPLTTLRTGGAPQPFRPGMPALDLFPTKVWERLWTRRWRTLTANEMSYGAAIGYRPLREAIAAYLGAARGVRCSVEQVIIVNGAQQAIDIAVRLLLDAGDVAWVENPGYNGAHAALRGAGVRLAPIPVDEEGIDVAFGAAHHPSARLVYVTPSHQYPLGVTMSLARRLALLQWAERTDAWILEDDYDSEYLYAGRPLAALQGLDRTERVIYIGTYSKVLFPALRLGYVIVPPALVDAFTTACAIGGRGCPTLDQAVLADFMSDGHFARHVRRMRVIHEERRTATVESVRAELDGLVEIRTAQAGLHCAAWLPPYLDDQWAAERLAQHHIFTPPLSSYIIQQDKGAADARPNGFVLGYGAIPVAQIRLSVHKMAQVLSATVDTLSRRPES